MLVFNREFVTLSEVYDAYIECRKHKRRKRSCIQFEINEGHNLIKLYEELNAGTYTIGYSDTFIVTRPKYREVFAADFRDRIVHHIILHRINDLLEEYFIDDSYSCRVGKGTLYGVNCLREYIKELSNNYTEDCYLLKCDIYSFFMSINKELLWHKMEVFLKERYKRDDLEWLLWLVKKVILHRPEEKCIKKGDVKLWRYITNSKSLFTNGEGFGLAIGNLTSQVFVNFFLTELDRFVSSFEGVRYGRYVDDFYVVVKTKEQLLQIISGIRKFLKINLEVQLHPDKWYIQHYSKGIVFVGSIIKYNRIYPGKSLINNVFRFLKEKYNGDLEKFVQRYNSYAGFLVHHSSYNIRKEMYYKLPEEIYSMTYIDGGFKALKIRERCKKKNRILN